MSVERSRQVNFEVGVISGKANFISSLSPQPLCPIMYSPLVELLLWILVEFDAPSLTFALHNHAAHPESNRTCAGVRTRRRITTHRKAVLVAGLSQAL